MDDMTARAADRISVLSDLLLAVPGFDLAEYGGHWHFPSVDVARDDEMGRVYIVTNIAQPYDEEAERREWIDALAVARAAGWAGDERAMGEPFTDCENTTWFWNLPVAS